MIRTIASIFCLGFAAATAQGADAIDTDAFFAAGFTGLEGEKVAMEQFRGRPLVVNFWARWCAPCREEIPELAKLRAAQAADGIEVVGVAIEEVSKREAVKAFAAEYAINYPVVLAGREGMGLMKALGNTSAGLPYTVYIGRDGKPVGSKLGLLRPAELEAAAQRLLAR